ncbi:MAG: hypothetical protein VW547_03100 [Alphaproteobacteria bacterium]
MTASTKRKIWFARLADELGARDGVTAEARDEGATAFVIVPPQAGTGGTADFLLAPPDGDFATLKDDCARLRDVLTALGIEEGATYVPEPPPAARPGGRSMTPQMREARAARKREFDAWQKLWKTLRKAEEALDVEYEIAQMKDYY